MVRYRLHTLECDESSSKPMYSFVFTLASVSWMLLSFLSLILMIFTINNARWIISNKPYNVTDSNEPVFQTLGINTRCTVDDKALGCSTFAPYGLSTDPDIFPTLWKIAFIFFSAGLYIIIFTTIASFASCHFHTIFNKSIFNIVGCIQALAGLFFVNAFIFYMGGWGSKKVISFCYSSAPFTLGECTLGTTFYYAVFGVVVTFVSACFSSVADRSIFRYKITRRVNAGKRLVCVL